MAVCHHYRVSHEQFLEWSQDSRDKAIWWELRRRATCSNCGTREEEWDPKQGGDRYAYGAELRRCRGCEVKAMVEDSIKPEDGRGLYVGMRKN